MRKNNCEPQKWATEHPFKPIKGKFGEPKAWDGFSSVFLFLAKHYGSSFTPTEKDWLKALLADEIGKET